MNAWPAVQTLVYDGWVLRFAGGYTRRANSVSPLYASTLDLDEKIETCERLYRDAGLPVVFKMTRHPHPAGLDEALGARGYLVGAETSVQVSDVIETLAAPPDSRVVEALAGDWLDDYCRMSAIDEARRPPLRSILERIPLRTGYVSVYEGGRAVACGLGVVEREWLGLFNVVTDPARRGRGHGRRLLLALLDWGCGRGATQAHLSVMADNSPALRLYAGAGFREVYRYWYRVGRQAP